MNKSYQKGRRAEYKIKKQLEKEGCEVLRTAGSHGRFDLIAFKGGMIRLIQLKHLKIKKPSVSILKSYDAVLTQELWYV